VLRGRGAGWGVVGRGFWFVLRRPPCPASSQRDHAARPTERSPLASGQVIPLMRCGFPDLGDFQRKRFRFRQVRIPPGAPAPAVSPHGGAPPPAGGLARRVWSGPTLTRPLGDRRRVDWGWAGRAPEPPSAEIRIRVPSGRAGGSPPRAAFDLPREQAAKRRTRSVRSGRTAPPRTRSTFRANKPQTTNASVRPGRTVPAPPRMRSTFRANKPQNDERVPSGPAGQSPPRTRSTFRANKPQNDERVRQAGPDSPRPGRVRPSARTSRITTNASFVGASPPARYP
jgi:hypothetical protein